MDNPKEEIKGGNPLDGGVLDPKPLEPLRQENKSSAFSSIAARTATGIVFVVAIVLSLMHPIAFLVLFALLTGLMTWEFCSLVNSSLHLQVNSLITTLMSVYFFFAVFDSIVNITGTGPATFFPVVISIMYLLISELYLKGFRKIENWAFAFMAFLYIALPMSLLNTMAFVFKRPETIVVDDQFLQTSSQIVYLSIVNLSIFIFLWCSDTGAYLIGSKFGKRRLFPSISPKKSWEGTIGGGVVALIASQVVATFSTEMNANSDVKNRLIWAGLALVVVVFGTWGDLVESRLKRKLGVKDSGNILPGHGGWLDRFDSALMAIPAAAVYLYLI